MEWDDPSSVPLARTGGAVGHRRGTARAFGHPRPGTSGPT